jgi:hypothetical protein
MYILLCVKLIWHVYYIFLYYFMTNSESDNPKNFKVVLQKVLYENSFYSLDAYFELQKAKYLRTIRIDI